MTRKSAMSRHWQPLVVMLFGMMALTLVIPTIASSGVAGPGNGVLTVTTSPELPAVISVDGLARNTQAVRNLELPADEYEICFGEVDGYLTPDCQTVTVESETVTEKVGTYSEAGVLEAVAESSETPWMVSLDGVERDLTPVSVDVAPGTYEVCFQDPQGHAEGQCQTVDVDAGETSRVGAPDVGAPVDDRVATSLVSLYNFTEAGGDTVRDVVGNPNMDLTIQNTSSVTWNEGSLTIEEQTSARTTQEPSAFYTAVSASDEFTVEAWVTPANDAQNGPARIVTAGQDTRTTNFFLGQGAYEGAGDLVEARLHERSGDWRLQTAEGSLGSDLTHLVLTRAASGEARIYVDGELAASQYMAQSLADWNESFQLSLGDEASQDRPWLGSYHLVALYDVALDAAQVEQNFAAGAYAADAEATSSPDPNSGEDDESEDDATRPKNPDDEREPGTAGQTDRIVQHGITWTFDDEYTYGTYANGDYWVVGPVDITEIDPASSTTADRTINGSMINPSPREDALGYGHIRANTYDPSLNVADGISADSPLRVPAHSSLVSTISAEEENARPGIETAAVLTVVDEVPPDGSFRPPYSGSDKSAKFNADELRYDLLPTLTPVSGTPDIAEMAAQFERVWLDHRRGWAGRKIHPATSMPDYGRDLASKLGEGSLMLMLDFSEAEKRDLLINFVQIGIDFHGIVNDGGAKRMWLPDGGHTQGRKWPILFAGIMLEDKDMAGIGHRDVYFGEDAQTFYVAQEDVDRGNGYSTDDLGMPEWGIRHATDPSRDDASWSAPYRQCCTANSWGGHVLSARIMGLQDAWNHDALFDYTDRYKDRESQGSWYRFWDRPFSERMWDTYRPQY